MTHPPAHPTAEMQFQGVTLSRQTVPQGFERPTGPKDGADLHLLSYPSWLSSSDLRVPSGQKVRSQSTLEVLIVAAVLLAFRHSRYSTSLRGARKHGTTAL